MVRGQNGSWMQRHCLSRGVCQMPRSLWKEPMPGSRKMVRNVWHCAAIFCPGGCRCVWTLNRGIPLNSVIWIWWSIIIPCGSIFLTAPVRITMHWSAGWNRFRRYLGNTDFRLWIIWLPEDLWWKWSKTRFIWLRALMLRWSEKVRGYLLCARDFIMH